jgi:urease accessory protein
MLTFSEKLQPNSTAHGSLYSTLTLTIDQRVRSRLKVTLDNGIEAGLMLPRGTVLQRHDRLLADSGEIIEVVAAAEIVSSARVDDPLLLARACYHLGNRHVPLQIGDGFVRYQHDHVLDDMLKGFGINVTVEKAPFEPEPGAYGGASSHAHHHAHGHAHSHEH